MDPNYKGRSHALFKCARAAGDKGLKVFGIENGGQCFASADGEKRYRKYGPSKDCKGLCKYIDNKVAIPRAEPCLKRSHIKPKVHF